MRSVIKAALEQALSRGGPAGVSRLLHRGRTLVLAYHNVLPDDVAPHGDASLQLPRRDFVRQLELLARTCEVIPLEQVMAAGAGKRPRVALTFDDAYRGTVNVAVDELAKRGLPATIFVPPAFLGGHTFWWDVFSDPAARGLPGSLRDRALHELHGSDARIREWAAATGLPEHPVSPWMSGATEEELATALRRGGVTLGAHSWSHPNLASLPEPELRSEVERPLRWLSERFPDHVLPWISYPYGLSSPLVEQVTARAGYSGALLVDGGWLPAAPANRFALPRFNVPSGISLDGLALRLSGLLAG